MGDCAAHTLENGAAGVGKGLFGGVQHLIQQPAHAPIRRRRQRVAQRGQIAHEIRNQERAAMRDQARHIGGCVILGALLHQRRGQSRHLHLATTGRQGAAGEAHPFAAAHEQYGHRKRQEPRAIRLFR